MLALLSSGSDLAGAIYGLLLGGSDLIDTGLLDYFLDMVETL